MRIHKLVLRGIGPFRDEQIVDVDKVSEQGLFLLDGPTGVGKSTVVDAIVFALFGTPASENGQDRMVSDFLGDNIDKAKRPFVELTFSTSAGVFRICREPKAGYINRNGKPAHHNATVRLERLAGEDASDGALVTARIDEVGREINGLLGMNREQVLSTIVLAQGQFANFLKAPTEQRRAILQSVFRTERYEKLQGALVERRKQAYRDRGDTKDKLAAALAGFIEASGLEAEAQDVAESYVKDQETQQALLDERVAALAQDVARLQQEVDVHQKLAAEAATALVQGTELANRIRTKKDLLEQQGSLVQQEPEIVDLREQLGRTAAASVILVPDRVVETRQADLAATQKDVDALTGELPVEQRALSADALNDLCKRLVGEKAELGDLLEVEAGFAEREKTCGDVAQQVADLKEAIAEADERLLALPAQIAEAQTQFDEAKEATLTLPAAELALRRATDDVETLVEVESLREQLEKDRAVHERESGLAKAAEEKLSEARRRYHDGVAAELAAALADGEACLVCGSVDHPRPAVAGADHVSAETVDEFETTWRELDERARNAATGVTAKAADLEAKERQLAVSNREDALLAQKAAQNQVDTLQGLARAQQDLGVKVKELTLAEQQVRDNLADNKATLEARTERHRILSEALDKDRTRLASARAGFDAVAARDRHIGASIDSLEKVIAARRSQETATTSLNQALAEFRQALSGSRFVDEADYRAAIRTQDWVDKSTTRVEDHGKAVHGVQLQLQSDALRDLDVTVEVDLSQLEQAALSAKQDADGRLKDLTTAQRTHERSVLTGQRVAAAWQYYEQASHRTQATIRLADLVTGSTGNLHGVTLATYVVQRRFAEVIAAANSHLAQMSDGRYALEATDESQGGERKLGLGLNVVDDRTDTPRSPATLSGGETFYVSLALALGLADVVQSEAGGISIETLFVDEGFGSLDLETLDTVIGVLTRLSRGNRTVGLISHVEEMKKQIHDRIEIHRPDPSGPSQIRQLMDL